MCSPETKRPVGGCVGEGAGRWAELGGQQWEARGSGTEIGRVPKDDGFRIDDRWGW